MYIYNVTIKLEPEILEKWTSWMIQEHIPDLMQTGLFTGYKFCKLLEQDDSAGETYVAQYFFDNLVDYERYIQENSAEMREKAIEIFGNKFIAFRTLMEEICSFEI